MSTELYSFILVDHLLDVRLSKLPAARQKDWVVIKAMEKPLINILWIGTGLLAIGFAMAMVRRFREI